MVPAPVDRCRDRTEGFGGRDFGPSDSERDGDAPPLMNVAAGAAALAAARGDKRARPHRRLPLAQRTNSESQDRTFVGRCFRTEGEACTGLGCTKLSRGLAW